MNEAAERLHNYFLNLGAKDGMSDAYSHDLDLALAAERKATVERIRAALDDILVRWPYMGATPYVELKLATAILDAEAER